MTIREFFMLFVDMLGKPEMENADFKKFFKTILDSEIPTEEFSKLFISIEDAAVELNVGTATVEALIKINNTTVIKHKGTNYIPRCAIENDK